MVYSQLVPKVNSYQVNSYPSYLVPTVNSYLSQLVPTVNSYPSHVIPKVNSYPERWTRTQVQKKRKENVVIYVK